MNKSIELSPIKTAKSETTRGSSKYLSSIRYDWDERFHVKPSAFNKNNHPYYKVTKSFTLKEFFDKPTRSV
jgi:hypothetical protein